MAPLWASIANALVLLVLCVLGTIPLLMDDSKVTNETDLYTLPAPAVRAVCPADSAEPMAAIYNTEEVILEASKVLLEGDAERAEGLFRQAMKQAQNQNHKVLHARAVFGLGCAETRAHKARGMETLSEARRAFELLDMKHDPQYVSLLVVIGGSLDARTQADAALAVLEMACAICRAQPTLRNSKHFVSALTVLGDVLDQKQDYENATKAYEAAVAVVAELDMTRSDDHVRLLCKVGSTAMKLANDEKAREWLERAAQQLVDMDGHATPRYAHVQGRLGRLYVRMNLSEHAIKALQTALELRRRLGIVSDADAKDEETLRELQKAIGPQVLHKELQALELQRILEQHRAQQQKQYEEQMAAQEVERAKARRRDEELAERMKVRQHPQ